MYKVKDILSWINVPSDSDVVVNNIVENVDLVQKNDVFIARSGNKSDGTIYIDKALKKGACLVLSEKKVNNAICLKNFYLELSMILYKFYKLNEMEVVGVTGTNGKSTTAYILSSMCNKLGIKTFLITTTKGIENSIVTSLTTPGICDLAQIIYNAYLKGYKRVVLECSSIGMSRHRLDILNLKYLLINKITSDHLDYHKTKKNYKETKINFALEKAGSIYSLYNYRKIKNSEKGKIFSQKIKDYRSTLSSSSFIYDGIEFNINFPFKYNAYNILICYNALKEEGYDKNLIVNNLKTVYPLNGRMERVGSEDIYVDYAHTYPALKALLKEVKRYKRNIICVIGAGGERDSSKRKEYGKVLARYAREVILTDDNPRNEDEDRILNMMKVKKSFVIIKDRSKAIKAGVILYKKIKDSVLLIIGKGAEDYQIIKGKTIYFSDKEEVKKCLD